MIRELPKSWGTPHLEELLNFVIGGDWGEDPEIEGEGFTEVFCIRGTEFRHWEQENGVTKVRRKVKVSSLEKRVLVEGDILIEVSGGGPDQPVGRTVLIDSKSLAVRHELPNICTNFIRLARPSSKINSAYLNYYLKSFYLSGEVTKYQGGSNNLRNLKFKEYCKILVPLAPLDEQTRIANKLDSLLAKVHAAQARLENIPLLLKRFRQSVLATAASGELTREWRGDVVSREDFLTWEFTNLPSSWQLKLLPQVSEARLGKMLDKTKNLGKPTRYLGNINVRWGAFDLNDLKEILLSEKEYEELKINDGDLLLCEGGEPGRGAVWKGGDNELTFQKALHRVRFDGSVLADFALLCIENDARQNRLSLLFTGTTIKHLTGKALKKYPLPIPPLEEQKEIVRRVESLFALSNAAERQYDEAKKRIDRLTESLLAKAFRGELVPQDPKEELASVLLNQIQVERGQLVANKSKRQASTRKAGNKNSDLKPSKTTYMKLFEAPKNYLVDLLIKLGDEAHPKVLWSKTELTIDDFYAKLKQEIQAGSIVDDNVSSDPTLRKLKLAKPAT